MQDRGSISLSKDRSVCVCVNNSLSTEEMYIKETGLYNGLGDQVHVDLAAEINTEKVY